MISDDTQKGPTCTTFSTVYIHSQNQFRIKGYAHHPMPVESSAKSKKKSGAKLQTLIIIIRLSFFFLIKRITE